MPRAKSKVLLHPWRLIANLILIVVNDADDLGKMVPMSDPNPVACSFVKIATRDTMTLWFDIRTVQKGIRPAKSGGYCIVDTLFPL